MGSCSTEKIFIEMVNLISMHGQSSSPTFCGYHMYKSGASSSSWGIGASSCFNIIIPGQSPKTDKQDTKE